MKTLRIVALSLALPALFACKADRDYTTTNEDTTLDRSATGETSPGWTGDRDDTTTGRDPSATADPYGRPTTPSPSIGTDTDMDRTGRDPVAELPRDTYGDRREEMADEGEDAIDDTTDTADDDDTTTPMAGADAGTAPGTRDLNNEPETSPDTTPETIR